MKYVIYIYIKKKTFMKLLLCAGERIGLDVGKPIFVQGQYLQRTHSLESVCVDGGDFVMVQIEYQQSI